MARRWDIFDLSPFVLVWLAGGALLIAIVVLALGLRLVDDPLVAFLTPLIAGNGRRGFAVGFASGLAPAAIVSWLLLRRRRDGAAWWPVTLIGVLLLLVTLLPFLLLAPDVRRANIRREPTALDRTIARELPGAGNGASAVFLGTAALLGGRYILGAAGKSRRR